MRILTLRLQQTGKGSSAFHSSIEGVHCMKLWVLCIFISFYYNYNIVISSWYHR